MIDKKEVATTFRDRFIQLRDKKTQVEFAEFVGIARSTVGFYESGERLPDAVALVKIAKACNVSIDWLLGVSDTHSQDVELKTICEKTGLSEKAIDSLRKDKPNALHLSVLNDFIVTKKMWRRLTSYLYSGLLKQLRRSRYRAIPLKMNYPPYYEKLQFAIFIEELPERKEVFEKNYLANKDKIDALLLELLRGSANIKECEDELSGAQNLYGDRSFDFTVEDESHSDIAEALKFIDWDEVQRESDKAYNEWELRKDEHEKALVDFFAYLSTMDAKNKDGD